MCYPPLTSAHLHCAYFCHSVVLSSFWAVGFCLPCRCLSMIKYFLTFKLKQQDTPENSCGSIFSIELIIICCLNSYKEQQMPHGKCGDGIFPGQTLRVRRDLSLFLYIHPALFSSHLPCEEVEGGIIKGSRFLPTHSLHLLPPLLSYFSTSDLIFIYTSPS